MNKGKQREHPSSNVNSQQALEPQTADPGLRSPSLSPERSGSAGTPGKSRFLRRSRSRQFSEQSKDGSVVSSSSQDLPPSSTTPPATLQDTTGGSFDFVPDARPVTNARPPSRQTLSPTIPPLARPSEDTGHRIGGWFTSMLSSSASISNVPSSVDDTASVRSFSSSASPSKLLKRSGNGRKEQTAASPAVSSTAPQQAGRMAGLDRMLGRAMQYLTDSDSNADRCPDDIWLLGVRHDGWRAESNDLKNVPARNSSSATLALEAQNGEPAIAIHSPSKIIDPPSRPGLASSTKRRLSRSSVKSQSNGSQDQQQTMPIASPLKAKSAAFFSALKGQSSQGSNQQGSQSKSRQSSSSPAGSPPTLVLARMDSGTSSKSSTRSISRISSRTSTSSNSNDQHNAHSPLSQSQDAFLPVEPLLTPAQTHGWPTTFYHDFYSRIQLTYRSGFPAIPSSAPTTANTVTHALSSMMTNLSASIGRSGNATGTTAKEEGLTSDTGWGCMLRTGQSLLANALIDVHLGRDFRRPPPLPASPSFVPTPKTFGSHEQYATYVRLLTWFLDDPTSVSPFSIHRFAAEGKRLGKQVGEWFGPSTAAGAIKTLANDFGPANLGVALAIDTTVYQSEVLSVTRGPGMGNGWNRPVLILVPLRLGISGVNPIYHNSIKKYFTLPQCVGIAGGRPSSSYYFIGAQADSLFYIDPHHTKPAVKSVNIPHELQPLAARTPLSRTSRPGDDAADRQALDSFFASSYSMQELESFHSDKVRKMSIAGLDPSMLVGLLCRTKEDWDDLCLRMKEISSTSTPIIHIVAEMPNWMRAPSRSMSGTAGQVKTATPSTPTGPAMTSLATADELEADDSFEYADSDDWDIDESDAGSILGPGGRGENKSDRSVSPKPPVKPEVEEEEEWTEATAHHHRRDRTDGSAASYKTAANSPREPLQGSSPASTLPEDKEIDAVVVPKAINSEREASLDAVDKEAGWEGLGKSPSRIRQISDESQRSQDTARQSLQSEK